MKNFLTNRLTRLAKGIGRTLHILAWGSHTLLQKAARRTVTVATPVVEKAKPHWDKASEKVATHCEALNDKVFPKNWEDADFMDDVRQATLRGAHPAAQVLFKGITAFLVIGLLWAALANLDEVVTGEGKVIPSSQVQTIQNLEGGIISAILVRDGTMVKKGQVLVRIDDTGAASSYGEKKAKIYSLRAGINRLEAEMDLKEPVFDPELIKDAPLVVESERALYTSRKQEFDSKTEILRQQVQQKKQEIQELQSKYTQATSALALARKELHMTQSLLAQGAVSKLDVLRSQRQVSDLVGERGAAAAAVPRAKSAMQEAQTRLDEAASTFKSDVLGDLAAKKEELARITEVVKAVKDQVSRTTVRSPVNGVVKRVLVTTVGGVLQPGMNIVEVVPLEDSLLVETRIRPKDVAFLRPNQTVKVKFTAYDYSMYGGLEGKLENIGADTVTDDKGNPFYLVRVRTKQNFLGTPQKPLPIMPGMVATVDVVTGEKSVLTYLLKPLRRMKEDALRER